MTDNEHARPATPTPGTGTPSSAGTPSRVDHRPGDGVRAVGIALALTIALGVMLSLFAWPAARLAPHDLPIAVAGPAPVTARVAAGLAQGRPEAFAVATVTTREEAVRLVRERQVYGALVVGPGGSEVLTASARSPVVAQLLGQAGQQVAAGQGTAPAVTDLVPLPAEDPRGAGLAAGLLPIVLGGLACAAATTFAIRKRSWRLVAAGLYAVIGGAALTWLLQSWLGSLSGNLWTNASVMALGVAAVAFAVLGLESVLGTRGLALGAALMMLLGNALSAAGAAPELLPTGWGALGQWLPAGATNTALRAVAFFDGHGAAQPLLVLAGWVVLGLLLVGIAGRTRRHATT